MKQLTRGNRILFFALIIAIVSLSSCSEDYEETLFEPQYRDSLSVLTLETLLDFSLTKFPEGFPAHLYATDSFELTNIGVVADELFGQIAETHETPNAFEEQGILFVVSQNPALVQVRTGSKISNLARWNGISAGVDYLRIQQTAQNDSLDAAVLQMIAHVIDKLPLITDMSLWNKMQYNQAASLIADEIDELGVPSESFYGDKLLRPVLKLRILELNTTGTWWLTYLLLAIVIYLVNKLITILFKTFATKYIKGGAAGIFTTLFTALIGLFLSIPALSSATILSSGRMEDMLALQASGIPYAEFASIGSTAYGMAAPIWLIGIMGVLRLLKGLSGNANLLVNAQFPPQHQQQTYARVKEQNPFAAGILLGMGTKGNYFEDIISEEEFLEKPYYHAYYNQLNKEASKAGLWIFLAITFFSKAVVMAAIFLWLMPVLEGYVKHIRILKRFNAQFPDYKLSLSVLIWLPLFFLAMFAVGSLLTHIWAYLLVGLGILMSGGLLLVALLEHFWQSLAVWQFWVAVLSVPLYFLVRLLVAAFQTDEKLRSQFMHYTTVTILSLGVLIAAHFLYPQVSGASALNRLFPSTVRVIKPLLITQKQGITTVELLNVRQGPGTNFDVLFTISNKDTFEICDADSAWWHIKTPAGKGYIYKEYADSIPALP